MIAQQSKIVFGLVCCFIWFGISAFTVPEKTREAEIQTLFKIDRSKYSS
jgi:hypothetical protein